MTKEEQRLKEKLLAKYSEVVDEMLRRCRDKEDFGELEQTFRTSPDHFRNKKFHIVVQVEQVAADDGP